MHRKQLDLSAVSDDARRTDEIVARLEGHDDSAQQLWGEEYAASGSPKTPTPTPPPVPEPSK